MSKGYKPYSLLTIDLNLYSPQRKWFDENNKDSFCHMPRPPNWLGRELGNLGRIINDCFKHLPCCVGSGSGQAVMLTQFPPRSKLSKWLDHCSSLASSNPVRRAPRDNKSGTNWPIGRIQKTVDLGHFLFTRYHYSGYTMPFLRYASLLTIRGEVRHRPSWRKSIHHPTQARMSLTPSIML